MHRLWPIGLTLLLACDTGARQDAAQAKANTPVAQPDDKPVAKPDDKPIAKPDAKPDAKLSTLLKQGRGLTKQGKYPEAIAKYREALAVDASNVSVLGELGWAAYKSGDLTLAHDTTLNALKFAGDDQGKQRGMLLYNLGRIEEDQADTDAAVQHYRDSLIARPGNATVQKRLDTLLGGNTEAGQAIDYSGTYTSGDATLTIRNFVAGKGFGFNLEIVGNGSGEECDGVDYSGSVKFTEPNKATNESEDHPYEYDLFKFDGGRVHFEPSINMIGMDCARQLDVDFTKSDP